MKTLLSVLLTTTTTAALGAMAQAQDLDGGRFTWEGTIELDAETVFDSDVPGNEYHDVYPTIDFAAEYRFSDVVSAFGAITAEPVVGTTTDRVFDDLGVYVAELGLRFDLGTAALSVGKISPAFGTAWDAAPGYFGTALAEDYELSEAIGGMGEIDMGEAGVLSLALFYFDDTRLSDSFGSRRGRNAVVNGGAGNTGQFDNVSLQWSRAFDSTILTVGARHLSAGDGDVTDETGVVLGLSHETPSGMILLAEAARFDGFGGADEDATYATLGAEMPVGAWTYSAVYSQRDIDTVGKDKLATLGLTYTFENDIEAGAGLAFVDEAGVKSKALGVSVVFPLGG